MDSAGAGTSAELLLQHEQWLSQDASHVVAWHRLCVLLPLPSQSQKSDLPAALASQVIAQAEAGLHSRRCALKTFARAGVGRSVGSLTWQRYHGPDWQTATGEQRTVILADGTQIQLNTDTAVKLVATPTERTLHLLHGELRIQTSEQAIQLVNAWASFTPLGTDFSLRQQQSHAQLSVSSGRVLIQHQTGAQSIVNAGQTQRLTAKQLIPVSALNRSDLAWQRGLLIAQNQRLDAFLTELGRYHQGYLRLHPSLEHLRVTGTFPANDSLRTLQLLCAILPIAQSGLGKWWVNIVPR